MSRFDLGYVVMLSLLHKNVFLTFCIIVALLVVWIYPLEVVGIIAILIMFLNSIKRGIVTFILSVVLIQTMECIIPWDGWMCNIYDSFKSEYPMIYILIIYSLFHFFLLIIERSVGRIGPLSISPILLFGGLLFVVPLYYFPSGLMILVDVTIITLAAYRILSSDKKEKTINKGVILLFLFFMFIEFTIGVIYSDDYIDNQSREMIEAYANYLSDDEYTYFVEARKEDSRSYEIELRRRSERYNINHRTDTVFVGFFIAETSPFRLDIKKRGWGMKHLVESVPYGKLFYTKKQRKWEPQ